MPIRLDWPEVSEEIYALGAPLRTRLQDTIRKGIVSAHRKDYKVLGSKQNFIQGDVATHGGNSGGPLLDAQGNITGLSVAGIAINRNDTGINFFIPIKEALDQLNIGY